MADETIQSELTVRVARELLGVDPTAVHGGPLQRNYFSLLFTVEAPRRSVVVKIPKADLRRQGGGIHPLTDADRALGRAEYAALELMTRTWRGNDVRVRWIQPVAYVEEFNAIVTERADAEEAWAGYLRLGRAQLAGSGAAGRQLATSLSRIAIALARFHQSNGVRMDVDGAVLAPRLRQYAARAAELGVARGLLDRLTRAIERLSERRWASIETTTFKGIDIRNVLSSADGTIWLVDPGKIKRTAREADIARFLFTWRILYWGTPWFALGLAPHRSVEAAFLDAYDTDGGRDPTLLDVFMLKETLKHWFTALDSLVLKGWPGPAKRLVRAVYIEPFYRRQLSTLLDALS